MRRRWVESAHYKAAIDALVELRGEVGLTQRQLAARLGKPPSYVAKIELRQHRLDVVEFVAWARALGMGEGEALSRLSRALPQKIEI